MDNDPRQVRVYHPSLIERLIQAEGAKGEALDEAEVVALVAEAEPIPTVESHARLLEDRRGYRDIDPDQPWADWQAFRAEIAEADDTPAD